MPDGLRSLGFDEEDIPALVKGTLPQVALLLMIIKKGIILTFHFTTFMRCTNSTYLVHNYSDNCHVEKLLRT